MASRGLMGPSEVASIGAWYSIVGRTAGVRHQRGSYNHELVGDWRHDRWGHGRRGWQGQGQPWLQSVQRGGGPGILQQAEHGLSSLLSPITSIFGEPGAGYRIPPRNALVQDPGPDRAGREVLPMSTGVAILPTQSAQITARPQRVAFRPERVFISAAGTSGGAADWVVNDIKIGNRSQFSQSGDVPGDMFATNAIDGFVSFETAQTAMDVVMVVTYIGLNESGVPFFASIVGTAAI
jgi:hypothetical protein